MQQKLRHFFNVESSPSMSNCKVLLYLDHSAHKYNFQLLYIGSIKAAYLRLLAAMKRMIRIYEELLNNNHLGGFP
jgi:hypothetical protein